MIAKRAVKKVVVVRVESEGDDDAVFVTPHH